MKLPLLLLDGLLSQCHVLHVLLQPVQWRVWLYTDPIIVVLGVPSKFKEITILLNLRWSSYKKVKQDGMGRVSVKAGGAEFTGCPSGECAVP